MIRYQSAENWKRSKGPVLRCNHETDRRGVGLFGLEIDVAAGERRHHLALTVDRIGDRTERSACRHGVGFVQFAKAGRAHVARTRASHPEPVGQIPDGAELPAGDVVRDRFAVGGSAGGLVLVLVVGLADRRIELKVLGERQILQYRGIDLSIAFYHRDLARVVQAVAQEVLVIERLIGEVMGHIGGIPAQPPRRTRPSSGPAPKPLNRSPPMLPEMTSSLSVEYSTSVRNA